MASPITAAHRDLYAREGYFIAERVIGPEHLEIMRNACDHLIDVMHRQMDELGVDHIHISHRGKRYHIAKRVLPYSKVGIRTLVEHIRDPESGDKCGYFGDEPGVPAVVPAGSLVVFSSLVFHRSGFNTTDRMRRAYVTQYSPEPIHKPGTSEPMHLAVPFLHDGRIVHRPERQEVAV